MGMRYYIAILAFLISCAAHGQGVTNFGATRPQDTGLTKGYIKAPVYSLADSNNAIGVNSQGMYRVRRQIMSKSYIDSLFGAITGGGVTLPQLNDSMQMIRMYIDSNDAALWGGIGAVYDTLTYFIQWADTATSIATRSYVTGQLSNYVPYTGAISDVNLGDHNLLANSVRFDLTPTGTLTNVGQMYWDVNNVCLSVPMNSNVTQQVGQEIYVRARNNTGVQINDGQVVYINDAQGNSPTIALANADSIGTSQIIGVATENIPDNSTGFVTVMGNVNGINTSAFSDGDALYLSATNGTLTNAIPAPPHNTVFVGFALNSTNNGRIFVNPSRPLAQDTTMAWNSNRVSPTQRAVKTFVKDTAASLRTLANGKVASVSGTSGRISSTGGTTPVVDLVTVNATPATYGDTIHLLQVAVDAYGRVTSINTVNQTTATVITTTNFTTSYTVAATNKLPIYIRITAQAGSLTMNAPTGLYEGQQVEIIAKATGSNRTWSWDAAFAPITSTAGTTTTALPTTIYTTASTTLTFQWDATNSKLNLKGITYNAN